MFAGEEKKSENYVEHSIAQIVDSEFYWLFFEVEVACRNFWTVLWYWNLKWVGTVPGMGINVW